MIFNYALSKNFDYFFNRINPNPSFIKKASSEHKTITSLIEKSPATVELAPKCFLQGSYDRQTSIYTINDVDIVTLCRNLYFHKEIYSLGDFCSKQWNRDEIFQTIATPLLNDGRYKDKVYYHQNSMCIKVDLGIKIEILPAIRKYYNDDYAQEPFYLYRPEKRQWDDGYARYHQQYLTNKNKSSGNFIPAIKVFKHLRSYHNVKAVSFHIECLLFSLPDYLFQGNSATYITRLLTYIAHDLAKNWYIQPIRTPCGERCLFTDDEWHWDDWRQFHIHIQNWSHLAKRATKAISRENAISLWQRLLGQEYFPKAVSQ